MDALNISSDRFTIYTYNYPLFVRSGVFQSLLLVLKHECEARTYTQTHIRYTIGGLKYLGIHRLVCLFDGDKCKIFEG